MKNIKLLAIFVILTMMVSVFVGVGVAEEKIKVAFI